jgi:hypothetical protein
MPVDNWLILALIMIFSSIIFCGVLPMIIRLLIARQRYQRYRIELQDIASSASDVYLNLQSIYANIELNKNDDIDSHEHTILYSQIPFIDDLTKDEETFV